MQSIFGVQKIRRIFQHVKIQAHKQKEKTGKIKQINQMGAFLVSP